MLATQSNVTTTPILVVIHNARGATAEQYSQLYGPTQSFPVETGSKKEVLSILKRVKDKLVKEGKIATQTQTQTETTTESNDSQQ
jgi:hypothetical protein